MSRIAFMAAGRKGAAAKPCERFAPGPVSRDRMERVYRESARVGEILATQPGSDALLISKASFHAEVVVARTKRRTRDDFAFVTRLRWAEQWIEIGLLSPGEGNASAFSRALGMIREAGKIFTGEVSPGCAAPETEIPPVLRDVG